jgi:parallel beta-helix repeat protein
MLFFSNYNTINNISVKFSQGFFIENSHGNIFTNNSVISSLGYGFDLYYSQNSIFRKNIANSNYIGFRFT